MPRETLFPGAGRVRADYDRVDWDATPLGDPATWSADLRSTLSVALDTRFPVTLFWGPDLVLVYNEAFVELIGDKHPSALGSPAREVFPEAWDAIEPMLASVAAGEGATWIEDMPAQLHRRGFLEHCWFTFSYSPVRAGDGSVLGILDIAAETTAHVLDRRRLTLLTALDDRLRTLPTVDALASCALPVLAGSPDLPEAELVVSGGPDDVPAAAPLLQEDADGRTAWFRVLERGPAEQPLLLRVRLSPNLAPDVAYLDFLQLVAGRLATAASVARAREASRRAAAVTRSMSEALQRSLLTEPPQPDQLEIAVRYLPATQDAQVGGDWYDAFVTAAGTTCLVVGDVSGHDQQAAAGMGQVRNVLRGIAYATGAAPASVLTDLDRAVRDLEVGALATCVLAQVLQTPEEKAQGRRRLHWSNAGHPPPLLLEADGGLRLLQTEPDLLLGLDPATGRTDHTVELRPGSTVLLFTDGLVERRTASLDDGLARLLATVERFGGRLPLQDLCDELVRLVPAGAEDDVALLALRVHAEAPLPRP